MAQCTHRNIYIYILLKFKYILYSFLSQVPFGNFKEKFLQKREKYCNLLENIGSPLLRFFFFPDSFQQENYKYAENYRKLLTKDPDFFGIDKYCNICGYRFGKFSLVGATPREGMCPVCNSLERHRHLFVHLAALSPFLAQKKVLHFAPESMFKEFFLQSQADYYDADIIPGKATYQIDITDISFDDNTFDYVICCHVLEHIPDDSKAMRELYRVLKPAGTAYLCVPLYKEFLEDPSITDPNERARVFGQNDHVRRYNREIFLQRLNEAGFDTSLVSDPSSFLMPYSAANLGDIIILARKIS